MILTFPIYGGDLNIDSPIADTTFYETYVMNFSDIATDDPWDYTVRRCFLYITSMPNEMVIRVHPPTTRAGVLCINGGSVRRIVPLS